MTKKAIKSSKQDTEADDNYDDEIEELNDEEDEILEEFDESDNEKDELNIEPDVEQTGCNIEDAIEDDQEYFEGLYEETEIPIESTSEFVPKENRISANRLTKYEMVRILGERTKQLTMGAKPLIKNYQSLSYDRVAEEELKLNMIPYKIKRPLPNGQFEIWTLDELNKEHLLSQLE
jgi:DNA-directed RNA polymerase subunit K/omega